MADKRSLLLGGCGGATAAAAPAWDPEDLTDSVWYDFTDPTTMTEDDDSQVEGGDGIKSITPKGSWTTVTPAVLTQSSAGARPTWNASGYADFSGSTAQLFNSTETFFGGTANSLPTGTNNELTMFALCEWGSGFQQHICGEYDTASGTSMCTWQAPFSGSSPEDEDSSMQWRDSAGGLPLNSALRSLRGARGDSSLHALVMTYGGTSDFPRELQGYIDGVAETLQTSTGNPAATTYTLNSCAIGGHRFSGSPGRYCNVPRLYHLGFVRARVSGSDLTSLNDWLKAEGGIS